MMENRLPVELFMKLPPSTVMYSTAETRAERQAIAKSEKENECSLIGVSTRAEKAWYHLTRAIAADLPMQGNTNIEKTTSCQ
jgi:hypothetical protein